MNTQTALYIAAALALGFVVGKRQARAINTAPTARNDINQVQDWWSYAGSWRL